MLSDEMAGSGSRSPKSLGGSSAGIMIYLEDVDTVFKQAVAAGAKVDRPLGDQFWGDRYGKITDPFGHSWMLATHKEDVSPEEKARRTKQAMAGMSPAQPLAVSTRKACSSVSVLVCSFNCCDVPWAAILP
jgi:PhnB protein